MVKRRERVPIKDAADQLGVLLQTLYNWRSLGRYKDRLSIRKAPDGKLYIPRGQFDRFVDWYRG